MSGIFGPYPDKGNAEPKPKPKPNHSGFDFDSHENFRGRGAPNPTSAGSDLDRIRAGGEADGEMHYNPAELLRFAERLESEALPICERGIDSATGIGAVHTGYFDHGFQLRRFCVDLEEISKDNFEALRRGVLTLSKGCRTIAARYENANEVTDDMVEDFRRVTADATAHFTRTKGGVNHDPDPAS